MRRPSDTRVLLALVLAACGGGAGTTIPDPTPSLPVGNYHLRTEEPSLGTRQDTTAIRVTSGTVAVLGDGSVFVADSIALYVPPSGAAPCSGKPRACWAGTWTRGATNALTATATVHATDVTLALHAVNLFDPAPPADRTYHLAAPSYVAYDSAGAGVYELRRAP